MNRYLYIIVCALAVTGAILIYNDGKVAGARAVLEEINLTRIESMAERLKVEDEISTLSDDELLSRTLGWVRNGAHQ